ncbi:acyltransferase family protein [Knoellia sp. Soil729]|uniref:acyltransferase family protein n=1 Tax=Knoellia sp. Soil729 TaxID=1736394 RepID=UPI000B1914A5|nr:acyltransferase family protein [Knoellia sp. Soil729]
MTRNARGPVTETSDRGAQLGYRPALDGLRAVAVVAVMLYHGGVGWAAGGFLGVDVFFVLSGFLITSLLAQEWRRHGRINLRAFWLRRARRLLPAMLVVLLAVAGYSFATDQQSAQLRGDSLATLGYVSNWWFMVSGQSYFAQFVEPSPLRHTWSLAIEEQYYIVFPLLLVVLLGRMRLRLTGVRALLIAGTLASAALMAFLYQPFTDPSRVYYGSDTRMQALLLGGVLALSPSLVAAARPVYTRLHGRLVPLPGATVVGWLAFVGLLLMFTAARELAPWMYRGGFLLAALLSAALIASVSQVPRSSLARLLSLRPVVATGVMSYGLYLWHWPVYVIVGHGRTGLDGPLLLAVRMGITALLAYASFRLVEEPLRKQRLQRRFTPTQWARVVSVSLVGVLSVMLFATASAQAPALAPTTTLAGRPAPVPDAQGRLVKAFLLGDSQSYGMRNYYGNRIDGLAVNGSTQLGCGTLLAERHLDGQTFPNLPACAEWEPRWTQEVAREKPDIVVLMLGLGELYDRRVDGRVVKFGTPQYRDWLYREVDRRRELVKGHAGRFALTTALCMKISADAANPTTAVANDPDRLAWLNETIRAYGSTHPDVPILDLHATVCSNGFTEEENGIRLRDDGLHLSELGAALVWDRIGPAMIQAGK